MLEGAAEVEEAAGRRSARRAKTKASGKRGERKRKRKRKTKRKTKRKRKRKTKAKQGPLAERVPEPLKPRVAGLIRLARKAGTVVVGIALTKESVREGRVRAVWIADDVSDRRGDVLLDRWRSAGVSIYRGWSKDELGELAGKPAVAVLSVTDSNIAAGVAQIVADAEPGDEERRGGKRTMRDPRIRGGGQFDV